MCIFDGGSVSTHDKSGLVFICTDSMNRFVAAALSWMVVLGPLGQYQVFGSLCHSPAKCARRCAPNHVGLYQLLFVIIFLKNDSEDDVKWMRYNPYWRLRHIMMCLQFWMEVFSCSAFGVRQSSWTAKNINTNTTIYIKLRKVPPVRLLSMMTAANSGSKTEFDQCKDDGDSVLQYLSENNVRGALQCCSVLSDEHVQELEHVLTKNHSAIHLTSLKLPNNGLTEESSEALANILRVQVETLRELDLAQNPLKFSGLKALMDPLVHGHPPSRLHSLNLTKTMLGVQGATAIASLLNHNNSLKTLNLSSNNLGTKGVKILAPAIQSNDSLESLNLSSNKISSKGGNVIAKAIESSTDCNLRILDISSNKIGDAGIQSFAKFLTMDKKLESFFAGCINIGPEGALHLATVLEFNYKLRHLKLQGNEIGPVGAKFLVEGLAKNQSTALEDLDLSYNAIGFEGAADIAQALTKNSKLTHLNLCGNGIGSGGCRKIAEALKYNLSLRELTLTNNQIENAGAFSLAMALGKPTCTLSKLDWRDNPIADEGLVALERVPQLRKNQEDWFAKMLRDLAKGVLFSVNLMQKKIGDEEVLFLTDVLSDHNPLIRTFWLNGKTLSTRSLVPLFERALSPQSRIQRLYMKECAVGDDVAAALGKALRLNRTLEVCSLTCCSISPKGAADIAEGLKVNSSLRRLNLDRNHIEDEGFKIVMNSLPHPTLTAFSACYNRITDESMSLTNLEKLGELSLNGNDISDRGAVRLCEALMGDCKLNRLCLRANTISSRGSKAIQNFLPENAFFEF